MISLEEEVVGGEGWFRLDGWERKVIYYIKLC